VKDGHAQAVARSGTSFGILALLLGSMSVLAKDA
jgi:hypothetical protein